MAGTAGATKPSTFNRNDRWRLKRAAKHLERSLDGLSRAKGELRPRQFAAIHQRLDQVIEVSEELHAEMEREAGPAEAEEVQAAELKAKGEELDLDDLDAAAN